MAQRKRYETIDDIGQLARARAKAGLHPDVAAAREGASAGADVGGRVSAIGPAGGLGVGRKGQRAMAEDEGGLAEHMGVPTSRPIPGGSARYPIPGQERQRLGFLRALQTDLPGYDVGDQAREYAAAGAPEIDPEFARGVAEQDPKTMAFIEALRRMQVA